MYKINSYLNKFKIKLDVIIENIRFYIRYNNSTYSKFFHLIVKSKNTFYYVIHLYQQNQSFISK